MYYSGYKTHIGLYGIVGFDAEMTEYKSGKGTLRFQLDKPLPAAAIKKAVEAKAEENAKKALARAGKASH